MRSIGEKFVVLTIVMIMQVLLVSCPEEIIVYTVSFNTQGGSNISPMNVSEGIDVPQPSPPVKSGFAFAGWFKDSACTIQWDFYTDKPMSSMTLYAKWVPMHIISFDSISGSMVDALEVGYGMTIREPAGPTKPNYIFGGWYRDIELTTRWDFEIDTVVSNITLYAKWLPLYTVSFNSQGGSAVQAIQNVVSGASISTPSDPSRAGHVFDGWYREASCTSAWNFASDTVVGNLTLYAKWYKHYTLGSTGPSGGYVFYDKGSYTNGWRYMEATHENKEWVLKPWGGYGTIVMGTEDAVGTGEANTIKIISAYGSVEPYEASDDYAARLCSDLVVSNGGIDYDDWFLPSIDEMDQMYINLYEEVIGGFTDKGYWSSTEKSNIDSRILSFKLGSKGFGPKYNSLSVRAARSF